MRRDEVVQSYLDLFENPSYLEIGVFRGDTFHALKAQHKVAVDPKFQFDESSRETGAEYCEIPSDDYFATLSRNSPPFDVVYLDGLHTFEQTLRDLLNSIDYLKRDGVVVIDDVLPCSYHSSLPVMSEAFAVRSAACDSDASWMGDVYRLVYFIQSFLPSFDYATVSENHGQLVMWRARRTSAKFFKRQIEEVARLEYRHVILQRSAFNLRRNAEIVGEVKAVTSSLQLDEAARTR